MNKKVFSKIAALAVVMTLATASLVAGTFAKYTTTVAGTDTVSVAKWVANIEGKGTASVGDFTFDLFETIMEDGVDGDLLAPGTTGSFQLDFDTTGTQVAHNITITMDASSILPALGYLKFYSDAAMTQQITTATPTAIELLDQDYGPTAGGSNNKIIYWQWPFENTPSGTLNDANDTSDGVNPITSADIDITFTATQLDVAP